MSSRRYPALRIRSKNELAKHISHRKFSYAIALDLVNDVASNFDNYWKDNISQSEPENNKYVRSAKYTPLGILLDNINRSVLTPHDHMLPPFIFGGVKGRNHVMAAGHLLGDKRKRTGLKLDIQKFFEQIKHRRVYEFFRLKCECKDRGAKLLADLCCVPLGPKGSGSGERAIARGFATSSRLAVWCNLDIFIKLDRLVQKRLKGRDPRVMVYVDDIGVTASRISKAEMVELSIEIQDLLLNSDKNQSLPINPRKSKIASYQEGIHQLGFKLERNKLTIGNKTLAKKDHIKRKLRTSSGPEERQKLKRQYKGIRQYEAYAKKQ